MKRGEVYLVCDAGGGTTDLNVLKVEAAAKDRMELVPLSWTEGEAVGSTLIDWKIRMLIKERLSHVKHYLTADIDSTVSAMMQDKFERFKCSFGSVGMDVPKLFLPIPSLPHGGVVDSEDARIEDSKMVITREELRAVFDDQIDKMCSIVDGQLKIVEENYATESVSYLILSGGLGSSSYVQSRIKAKYEWGARAIKVLLADEPQLAVVHGLVLSRIQSRRGGPEMYSLRMCPVSFGIICREGQVIRAATGVSESYRLKLDMGKEKEPWRTRVVMSTLPVDRLPRSLKWEGAQNVCGVETILNPRDMKRKNRHWYDIGKEYNRADFEVRVLVGTGLRYEIWSKDGIRSREHDEIEVDWQTIENQLSQRNADEAGLGIYRS
ncbi:hypothetical protein LTR09_011067 [Extremus antarcticus]|uniref:Uncharacterized protein n=1 Tax=Extremus antarcticus TaxID=702011 RepID=A0AAJ0DCR0_9PEZI|nr:hypothetical protein LTR09_011067 [Extremus antarcticus]